MGRRPPSGNLTLVDFLDVALLGAIVLSIGVSLVTPVTVGTAPPGAGPVGRTTIAVVRTVGSLSGVAEQFGALLVLTGVAMLLVGPLWVFVVQPLARRGYL